MGSPVSKDLTQQKQTHIEGQLFEEVRDAAGVGHLVSRSGVDYQAHSAELSVPRLRSDPQAIRQRGDLGNGALRQRSCVNGLRQVGQWLGEGRQVGDDLLGRRVHLLWPIGRPHSAGNLADSGATAYLVAAQRGHLGGQAAWKPALHSAEKGNRYFSPAP